MESEDDMSYMIGVMSKIDDILTTVGKSVQKCSSFLPLWNLLQLY